MTALVYLRSSFGFGFLRPKSVFLACSWVFLLYAIYAWFDGEAWQQYHTILMFGSGAVALYAWHLTTAAVREQYQVGGHEQYSGRSHLIGMLRKTTQASTLHVERMVHLWMEPLALLDLSVLGLILREHTLPFYFCFVAGCLWSKEALNQWFQLRQAKHRKDSFDDAEDAADLAVTNDQKFTPLTSRKSQIKRIRRRQS